MTFQLVTFFGLLAMYSRYWCRFPFTFSGAFHLEMKAAHCRIQKATTEICFCNETTISKNGPKNQIIQKFGGNIEAKKNFLKKTQTPP